MSMQDKCISLKTLTQLCRTYIFVSNCCCKTAQIYYLPVLEVRGLRKVSPDQNQGVAELCSLREALQEDPPRPLPASRGHTQARVATPPSRPSGARPPPSLPTALLFYLPIAPGPPGSPACLSQLTGARRSTCNPDCVDPPCAQGWSHLRGEQRLLCPPQPPCFNVPSIQSFM